MSYVVCRKSRQTESACIATFKFVKSQHNVTPTRHETYVARQNIFVYYNTSLLITQASRDKSKSVYIWKESFIVDTVNEKWPTT